MSMTKISLTPIIDVVFILLIFFMLATNFQDFSKTDIKLSQDKAKATLSDERVFIIEFNAKEEFKLNNQSLPLDKIKLKIKSSEHDDENILVVAKPSDGVNVQLILTVIEDLKKSKIENVMLGVTSDNAKDSYQFKRKESQKLPMLEKL